MTLPSAPSSRSSPYRTEQAPIAELPLFRNQVLAITTQAVTVNGTRYSKTDIRCYRLEGAGPELWRSTAVSSVILLLFCICGAVAKPAAPPPLPVVFIVLAGVAVAMFANSRIRAKHPDERTFRMTIRATPTSSAFDVFLVAGDALELDKVEAALERIVGERVRDDS